MTPEQINGYITIISILVTLGADVTGKVKQLIHAFHPEVVLTDDEINAIEQAGIADSIARKTARDAMAQPDATGHP